MHIFENENEHLRPYMKRRQIHAIIIILIGAVLSISFFDRIIIQAIISGTGLSLNEEFRMFGLQHLGIELIVLGSIIFLSALMHNKNKLFLISVIAVILLFFTFLYIYAVNIPINDDFEVILNFSNRYFFSENASEKSSLLSSYYCETRFITLRFATIFLHFITGAVNFKSLIIIANCCLLVVLFLYCKSMSMKKCRMEITLIIALLFFHFGYYDAVIWATNAFVYQFTTACVMLSLFLINKSSVSSQIIAVISAILAALTFGNGLVVFPIVIFFFVLEKKWKFVFLWTALAVLFFLIYFQGFSSMNRVTSIHSLFDYIIYSCCFLGSAFQFMYKLHLPFIAGGLIWALFIVLTIKKYYRKNFFIYGLIIFAIVSSLIAAHFRISKGLDESISNRYGFFSILVICSSIIALSDIINERRQNSFLRMALGVCIAFHLLCGVFFFPEVPVRKQKLEAFIDDINNNAPVDLIRPIIPAGSDSIVKEAIRKEIYFP
ncbi:MAG: hypothetical protein KKA07_08270 [Bacteroidetes bacterium]|nr:hypothetical protein [Bacteroidota bacterium]